MNTIRRLGFGLATLIFSSLITIFALFISVFMVLGKPDPLLSALQTSGLYSAVAPTIFDQQAKQQDNEGKFAFANPAIRSALIEAFPPAYVQTTVETNVRSLYSWIHGQTTTPVIQVDVSTPRALFAKNIGNAVKQRLESLPECKNIASVPATPEELLAMTCRPPGVSEVALVENAERQASTSNVFAGTAEHIVTLQGSDGQPLSEKLRAVPRAYQYFVWSLFVIPFVLALCAAAIIFCAASKRAGLKSLGRMLITTGIIGVILALGAGWLLSNASSFITDQNPTLAAIQSKLLEVLQILGGQLQGWWLGISLGYVIIGIGALFLGRTARHVKTEHNKALNESMGYRNDVPTAGTKFDPHTIETPNRPKNTDLNEQTAKSDQNKNTTA